MIQAVVFDLDGVLIDTEPVWEEVRRGLVAESGGTWLPDAQTRLMGMSTGEWSRYLAEDLGVGGTPEEVAAEVLRRMAARYETALPLIPGAVEAVRRIGAEYRLAVASSSARVLIDHVLAAAEITELFEATVSTEEVPRGKPAPDAYLTAASRLGLAPEVCAAVEDSSNGLRSASAAGLAVVAIPQPAYPPAGDALMLADKLLMSLAELTPELIASLRD
ncbi:HAD superfamily hydrolase (TIGR01509 family) [Catenuloplanes nepalensis]|uniref:HAD superfamily hydrolase (TIGR01509 family) n=1 Tax=Catenuloplanes nepalensis TaxID=587533 RepID=A0ABT9MYQ4_9ACTN|nr:HAD family phosphatase [Catenuloplanes nepalensis]MDP9796383.1 HAD superfamily hydrolase (TIGR01509 family) [Catenuloplanes nepalensis]